MQKSELPDIRLLKNDVRLFSEREVEKMGISKSMKNLLEYIEERNLNGVMPLRKNTLNYLYENDIKISDGTISRYSNLVSSYSVHRVAETFGERTGMNQATRYKMPRSLSFIEMYMKSIVVSHKKTFSRGPDLDNKTNVRCMIAWTTKNGTPVFSNMFSYSGNTK